MAKTAILAIRIISDAKGAQKGFDEAASGADKFGASVGKASAVAAVGIAAAAAAGFKLAQSAAADQASAAKLALSLRNTTKATDAQVSSVEDWITAQGKALGVADDELRPALATLATATGDVAKAQELAALAMDVAAAKGISVEQASNAIAKAAAGQTTALGKLVPGIDRSILASGDLALIQAELARITGGQAATAANTAAGQQQRLALSLSETGEAIGAALLPVIETLLPYLQQAADWASRNTTLLLRLAAVVLTAAAAIVTINAALKAYRAVMLAVAAAQKIVRTAALAWTAAQWLLNVALLANPIGLIVVAVAALIAIFVIAYKKSDTFRGIIDGLWQAIQKAVRWIGDLIRKIGQIEWPEPPSWLRDIGSGIGNIFGASAPTGVAAFSATGRAAPSVPTRTTVNVAGVLDPVATANAIRRSLISNNIRLSRVGAWAL